MSIKKRLSPEESRSAAIDAARAILLEQGPQAVTLKAVAAKIGRTHANLLHHFGSAAELQRALARHLGKAICAVIAEAVIASRSGAGSARRVVDLTFDAFNRDGAGMLASWMRITGNEDALDPIVESIHDMVDELDASGAGAMRDVTLALALMALGDAQMGVPLSRSLALPRDAVRDFAEQLLLDEAQRRGLVPPETA